MIAVCSLTACSSADWEGIKIQNDKSVDAGHFDSLESCKAKMKESGGYCGKRCHDYGDGSIADCDSLVAVSKQ
jgi:hypothetical protein